MEDFLRTLIPIFIVLALVALIVAAGDEERKKKNIAMSQYKGSSKYQQYIANRNREEQERRNLQKSMSIKDKASAERFIKKIKEIIYENRYVLLSERNKLLKRDAYGNIDYKDWYGAIERSPTRVSIILSVGGGREWQKGIPYFFKAILLPKLYMTSLGQSPDVERFFKDYENYCNANPVVIEQVGSKKVERRNTVNDWFIEIAYLIENTCNELEDDNENVIKKDMSGIEYEQYCKKILQGAGWDVEDTPVTGDQGVDLIASIEDLRLCIQCKCFAKPVGNKAVQEIAAGKTYWKGTHAVVVGKSGFTKSAKSLAESTKVILITDSELEDLENIVL